MRIVLAILLSYGLLFSAPSALAGEKFSHTTWDTLLKETVVAAGEGHASVVDYRSLLKKRNRLRGYLDALSTVSQREFDQWSAAEQLAFLINSYNAWTVELVLRHYPKISSIRDIGGWWRSPWRIEFIPLLGKTRSLDDIEHGLIRGSEIYDDPRIHFAVNCASIGCPALALNAFTGEDLEQQLQHATQQFLSDASRNYLRDGRLYLSKIFSWYNEDFVRSWRGASSLNGFLLSYADDLGLSEPQREKLRRGDMSIRYLDYDWRLNDGSALGNE